jgi:phage baseplate assembly protein V
MMAALNTLLKPLKNSVRLMIGRAIIRLVNDAGPVQRVQVDRLAGETADDLEVFGWYGFGSYPHPGAEAIVTSLGGVRSHGVVIAVADRRYRLLGMQEGEVALFDDLGQKVHLTRSGIVIEAPEVTVTTNHMIVDADQTTFTGNVSIGGNLGVDGDVGLGEGAVLAVKLADNTNATKVKAK